jgi:hypothetical protein
MAVRVQRMGDGGGGEHLAAPAGEVHGLVGLADIAPHVTLPLK